MKGTISYGNFKLTFNEYENTITSSYTKVTTPVKILIKIPINCHLPK